MFVGQNGYIFFMDKFFKACENKYTYGFIRLPRNTAGISYFSWLLILLMYGKCYLCKL